MGQAKKYKVGDKVYWVTIPKGNETAEFLDGVVGEIIDIYRFGDGYVVLFNTYDKRAPFFDHELISEELFHSPLYEALR